MEHSTRSAIIGLVVIAFLAVGAYFLWRSPASTAAPTGDTTATTTEDGATKATTTSATNSPKPTTPVTPSNTSTKAPNAAAPLSYSVSVTADQRATMEANFVAVQSALQKNKTDFDAWIMLGNLRKEAGDYAGAAADWNYVSQIYPGNIVSFANLADLDTFFLHDYAKADVAYRAAIKNDPVRVQLYDDLYALYTNQYPHDTAVIETMLKQAIPTYPKVYQLQVQLARYYVATHQTALARASYEAAVANANAQGKTDIAAGIQTEELRI